MGTIQEKVQAILIAIGEMTSSPLTITVSNSKRYLQKSPVSF